MKQILTKGLSVLLSGVLLTCPIFATSAFPDVPETAYYAEAVTFVGEIGFMVGDETGNFNPNDAVTRAEMATILCNMVGETENLPKNGFIFADVPENHWANPYVIKAAELGLVSGYGDGRYGPSDILTYEQGLTMVISTMGLGELAANYGGYPDGFIYIANDYGYNNNMSVQKGDPLTRAQVAILVYNTIM